MSMNDHEAVANIFEQTFATARDIAQEMIRSLNFYLANSDVGEKEMKELGDLCSLSVIEAAMRGAAIGMTEFMGPTSITEERITKMLQAYRLQLLDLGE